MTDIMTAKKPKKQKVQYPFPVELIDRLLAQVENKDAESILGDYEREFSHHSRSVAS